MMLLTLTFFHCYDKRNAAYSTLCTLTRASVPEIVASAVFQETGPIIEELMREVRRTVPRLVRPGGIKSFPLIDYYLFHVRSSGLQGRQGLTMSNYLMLRYRKQFV